MVADPFLQDDIVPRMPARAADTVDSYEVEREAVIAMLERERRSLTSSLIALSLFAVAIAFLPDLWWMACLLALRVSSFLLTRTAASRLENRVRARQPLGRAPVALVGAMSLTGVTLALMLWPQPAAAPAAAVATIHVVTVVAVTLIAVTLAALPAPRDAMLGSFWATACTVVLLHPANPDLSLIWVITVSVMGIRIYSHNTGQHIRNSAEVLVENRQLSEDLADALAHAEFLSWRDPLTGLLNRRKLFEVTRTEGSVAQRFLLTIDLDRFKAVNDAYGHAAGDHVLIASADTIRAWIEEQGKPGELLAFRLGGEEFLVIARGLDETTVETAADELRRRIAAIPDALDQYPGIKVTASIGLAEWRFRESLDDALLRADLACYEAKGQGRNTVRRAA